MSLINKVVPIIIVENDDGFHYPVVGGGYNHLILPSDFSLILEDLQDYCMNYTDEEISKINQQIVKDFHESLTNNKVKQLKNYTGYVYVLKCADKYKIGYSKDVNRRIKELDTRPFKLELLLTVYSTKAYIIEQELHHRLQEYRETGEWYSNITESVVKQTIKEIVEDLKCDIQY